MDAKLTLRLDKAAIDRAKSFAEQYNTSLSRMVENFFKQLDADHPDIADITPMVQNLSGIITLPDGFDYRENYIDFLKKKYDK